MKKLLCLLFLFLCLALPALSEDVLPDFEPLTNGALTTKEQLVLDSCVRTGYTGPAEALTQAVDAYLVQLCEFGMQQQFKLPLQQKDCTVTLYAFVKADAAIPTMTCADAALGWVISETHLLVDLRVYANGEATVEIIVRPELLAASAAQPTAETSAVNAAAITPCGSCQGQGIYTQNCSTCDGDGQIRSKCSSCGGNGQRNCSNCGGDGKRTCGSCNGSGHHSSGHHGKHHSSKSCSSCSGRGQRSCSSCSGHGYRSCGSCSGKGQTYTRCTSCNSTGHYTINCTGCGGSGVIK